MSVVTLFCFSLWSLSGVFGESMSVTEGDSVILSVDVSEVKDGISWKFGFQDVVIAEINADGKNISLYEERADGRFRDRLKMDHAGSLIIKNISNTHSGLYKVINTNTKTQLNIYNITVYARLPVPVITRDCSSSSSSSSSSSCSCSVLCWVMNVSDVSLSWYKGISLLSIISVSDLHTSVSLHLEVEYQDTNTYTCVINNPITNQTQHLSMTQLCHKCSDLVLVFIVVMCCVGSVIVTALLMFFICKRHRNTRRQDQAHEDEILYRDSRNKQITHIKEHEVTEVVYMIQH